MEPVELSSCTVLALRSYAAHGRLFSVLDACDAPSVPELVRALGPRLAVSLYQGPLQDDLGAIAPHVVHTDIPTLDWIASTLWGNPWGIFAVSSSPLEAMRVHFRRFLMVRGSKKQPLYFRYYDPRVLSNYLASCNAVDAMEFFGPVEVFAWTDPATYGVATAKITASMQMAAVDRDRPVVHWVGGEAS